MGILDLVFPRHCVACRKTGSYLCANCFALLSFDTRLPCSVCNRPSFDGLTHPVCQKKYSLDGMFASLVYTRTVKKLIASYKYKPYVSDLTYLLGALFVEGIIQEEGLMQKIDQKTVLVPIPLHVSKLRERGYNHADLLGGQLAQYLNLSKKDVLKRPKKTRSQYGLTRDERRKNISNAFACGVKFEGEIVVLVDDIVTTGLTFYEAAGLLKSNGAQKVYGVALAHGL